MPYLVEHRELLQRFRAGERNALSEVYRHYAPGVAELLRHGFAFGGDGQSHVFRGYRSTFDLENALQEVFARAFQESARLRYDGLRPYVNYVYAIARNYVIDQLRRRELLVIDAGADGEAPVPPEQEDNIEAGELSGHLAAFVAERDEREQRFFRLRFGEGLTQEQVATALQLTRIQVRRIEARVRRDLFAYLSARGYLGEYQPRTSLLASTAAFASAALPWRK